MTDVTRILNAISQGDARASDELLPLVYDQLRHLAAHRIALEKSGQTLDATALVHEAYVRLVSSNGDRDWDGRGHFYAAAAEAMRRILVENARRKARIVRGGDRQRVDFQDAVASVESRPDELLAIDEALEELGNADAVAARIVKLRYFTGLSVEEAGQISGLSRSSAYDHWAFARAWLKRRVRNT